jgi:hypothetical protein
VEDFLLSLSNIHSNTAMCEGNPQEGFSPNPNVSRNFVLFENNVAFEVNVRGQVVLFEPRPLSHGVVQQPDGLGNLNNPNVNGAQNPVNNLQQINDAPSANTQ